MNAPATVRPRTTEEERQRARRVAESLARIRAELDHLTETAWDHPALLDGVIWRVYITRIGDAVELVARFQDRVEDWLERSEHTELMLSLPELVR